MAARHPTRPDGQPEVVPAPASPPMRPPRSCCSWAIGAGFDGADTDGVEVGVADTSIAILKPSMPDAVLVLSSVTPSTVVEKRWICLSSCPTQRSAFADFTYCCSDCTPDATCAAETGLPVVALPDVFATAAMPLTSAARSTSPST